MGFERSFTNYMNGKWVTWTVQISQPDGAGPSNINSTRSKYTLFNGSFYGHLFIKVPTTSDLGQTGSHWELKLPFKPAHDSSGNANSVVIGNGFIIRYGPSNPRSSARLNLVSYYVYPTIAAFNPILPYYNAATMDYTPDPNYLYEDWMATTQAKVEATKTAWQAIATDFGRESQSEMWIMAHLKYMVKY